VSKKSKGNDSDGELYFEGELENEPSQNKGNDPSSPEDPDQNQQSSNQTSDDTNDYHGTSQDDMNDADQSEADHMKDNVDNENNAQQNALDQNDNQSGSSNNKGSTSDTQNNQSNTTNDDQSASNDDDDSDDDGDNNETSDNDNVSDENGDDDYSENSENTDDSLDEDNKDDEADNNQDSDDNASSNNNGNDQSDTHHGGDDSQDNNQSSSNDSSDENSGMSPYSGNMDESNSDVYSGQNMGVNPDEYNDGYGQSRESDEKDNDSESKNKDNDKSNDLTSDQNKDSDKNHDSNDENDTSNQSKNKDQQLTSEDSKNGLKDRLLGELGEKSDTINKAKNLKNLSKMKKENAASEVKDIGKDLAKEKIKMVVITAIGPYIGIIAGVLLLMLILIFILIGAVTGGGKPSDYVEQQCTEQDKNGGSSDVSVSGDQQKTAKTIYKYLMEHVKGLTPKQASGLMGAITFESQLKTDALNGSSGAYGIAQWLGARKDKLEAYASKHDGKKSDLKIQLGYLEKEISSGYEYQQLKSQGFFDAKSLDGAMKAWLHGYERAGPGEEHYSERLAYAKKWYSKFSDMKVDSSKAKKPGGKDDNISDAEGAASDNSDDGGACSGGGDDDIKGKIGDSVAANGGSGKVIKDFHGHIPAKYKKYVKAPKFDKKYLAKSNFGAFGCAEQCTELTWAYMTQMWTGDQPDNGNGHDLARSYKAKGAKVTNKPTVGYGFSSDPPYAGSGDASTGHTGVVVGVLPGGKWILANYNLHLEAPERHLTYALVDGNPKKGGTKFFSGIGKVKKKYKK